MGSNASIMLQQEDLQNICQQTGWLQDITDVIKLSNIEDIEVSEKFLFAIYQWCK